MSALRYCEECGSNALKDDGLCRGCWWERWATQLHAERDHYKGKAEAGEPWRGLVAILSRCILDGTHAGDAAAGVDVDHPWWVIRSALLAKVPIENSHCATCWLGWASMSGFTSADVEAQPTPKHEPEADYG